MAILFSGLIPGVPKLHFFYVGFIAQILIIPGIALVALLTPEPDYQRIAPYIWSVKILQQYDSGTPRPWYQSLKFWWGLVAVVWFYLYWRFW